MRLRAAYRQEQILSDGHPDFEPKCRKTWSTMLAATVASLDFIALRMGSTSVTACERLANLKRFFLSWEV